IAYTPLNAAKEPVSALGYYILMGGPGQLLVQAGRNIDFGNAAGIESVGNQLNKSLPDTSAADVAAIAGVRADSAQAGVNTLFDALAHAGKANDAAAGDAAIAALFKDTGPGDIKMVHSSIKTAGKLSDGKKCSSCGNIDLLAPRGSIEVGLVTQQQTPPGPTPLHETLQLGVITGSAPGLPLPVRHAIHVNTPHLVTLFR